MGRGRSTISTSAPAATTKQEVRGLAGQPGQDAGKQQYCMCACVLSSPRPRPVRLPAFVLRYFLTQVFQDWGSPFSLRNLRYSEERRRTPSPDATGTREPRKTVLCHVLVHSGRAVQQDLIRMQTVGFSGALGQGLRVSPLERTSAQNKVALRNSGFVQAGPERSCDLFPQRACALVPGSWEFCARPQPCGGTLGLCRHTLWCGSLWACAQVNTHWCQEPRAGELVLLYL